MYQFFLCSMQGLHIKLLKGCDKTDFSNFLSILLQKVSKKNLTFFISLVLIWSVSTDCSSIKTCGPKLAVKLK